MDLANASKWVDCNLEANEEFFVLHEIPSIAADSIVFKQQY